MLSFHSSRGMFCVQNSRLLHLTHDFTIPSFYQFFFFSVSFVTNDTHCSLPLSVPKIRNCSCRTAQVNSCQSIIRTGLKREKKKVGVRDEYSKARNEAESKTRTCAQPGIPTHTRDHVTRPNLIPFPALLPSLQREKKFPFKGRWRGALPSGASM